MPAKPKTNKEILQELIDKIKGIKRIPQGKISLLAGYESENYLSELKSTGEVTDNVIKALRALYDKALIDPGVLDYTKPRLKESLVLNEEQAKYSKEVDIEKEFLKKRVEDLEKIVKLLEAKTENAKNA